MKNIFAFLFCGLSLYGQSYPYFMSDTHAFMPDNSLDLSFGYMKMDDNIDVLNIKESEVGSAKSDTSLGDLVGKEYLVRYKIYDNAMLSLRHNQMELSYGLGDVLNKRTDFFIRHQLISKTFAIDLGIVQNKASDIISNDIGMMNSLIRKFLGSSSISIVKINDPTVLHTYEYTYKSSNGDELSLPASVDPFAGIINLKDESYYIRGVRSFVEDGFYSFDVFAGISKTKVSSYLDSSLNYEPDVKNPNSPIYNALVSRNLTPYKDLNRKENKVFFGVGHSWFVNNWLMDIVLTFDYIKRDNNLNLNNKNIKIDFNLGYKILDNMILFLGAKIMSNQFVGEIPYLYNEYTKTSFDKKYGWAKSGIMLKF